MKLQQPQHLYFAFCSTERYWSCSEPLYELGHSQLSLWQESVSFPLELQATNPRPPLANAQCVEESEAR